MRTFILTLGTVAKRLLSDPEVVEPLAGAVQKATGGASEVAFLKVIINIVLPNGR